MDILIVVVLVILGLAVFVALLSGFLGFMRRRFESKQKHMVLAIRMPKTSEVGPIVAEQIFATLHGFFHKIPWWKVLLGKRQDKVSFEIAHTARQIKFFIWFPNKLRNLVEGQIYAQYPNAEIEEVEDYASAVTYVSEAGEKSGEKTLAIRAAANKANAKSGFSSVPLAQNAVGAEIKLEDPVIYPIKRYQQFEDKLTRVAVDPISSITATLTKLHAPDDQAWIQVIVRPLDMKWRVLYVKCLRIVTKGIFGNIESLKKAYIRAFITRNWQIKLFFFPVYMYFWFRGITSGMKHGFNLLSSSEDSGGGDELREEMSSRHDKETDIDAAMDKISKLLFEVTIRVVYAPQGNDLQAAQVKVREIAGSFKQFNIPQLNGFGIHTIEKGSDVVAKYQKRKTSGDMVLNSEELATIYHLPHMSVATPNIAWVRSRKLEPPVDLPNPASVGNDEGFTVLGKTNFRGSSQEFGIKTADRRRHIYVIGKTGMGKTTLLENMLLSDIRSGKGVAIVDPHGDVAEKVLDFVPSNRTNDVILFDPADRDFPVAFNMLENVDPAYNSIVASGLVGIFKKIYAESWGPRLEHILRNTILALLEYPNTTMLGITRILQDPEYRRRVVKNIQDPMVKSFWVNEFERMEPRMRVEAISPILNKVGQFLASPIIRNIVGQPKSSINLRFAMDNKKIVIVNLSKGKIGEDNSSLLGAMVITKFQLDAMSRANVPEKDRVDFYLYVDEFQNFATESFATILSEARKYKLALTMANQYIAQMPEEVCDAVFGNVGSLVSFQVGFDDAEKIAGQFGGDETMLVDLVALQVGNTYMRLLIDGMPTPVFSMTTFRSPELEIEPGRREKILKFCHERYSASREDVEDKIKRWSEGQKLPEPKEDKQLKAAPEGKDAKKEEKKKPKKDK
jgi:hypothetical protein